MSGESLFKIASCSDGLVQNFRKQAEHGVEFYRVLVVASGDTWERGLPGLQDKVGGTAGVKAQSLGNVLGVEIRAGRIEDQVIPARPVRFYTLQHFRKRSREDNVSDERRGVLSHLVLRHAIQETEKEALDSP